jgi:hypothetical protein
MKIMQPGWQRKPARHKDDRSRGVSSAALPRARPNGRWWVHRCVPAALLLLAAAVRADFQYDAFVALDPKVEAAIEKAQTWLAGCQRKDGSWGNNGDNGMAIVALMVNGNTPGKGKFGAHIARGIEYIVSAQRQSGLLISLGGKNAMYEHAIATLALAEVYGMTQNPAIRNSLIRAVDLIVRAQHQGGGWRYAPRPVPGDLSVTVMQVMALRAAAELGIFVPDDTIKHAVRFIKACWHEPTAGFGYTGSAETNLNRAGAGVVCLQSIGLHDDPMVTKAVATILTKGVAAARSDGRHDSEHFWYGHYYGSVALYHHGGEAWKTYYPAICDMVLKDWANGRYYHHNGVINTAWAILTIGVPYRYLPIYQR